VLKEGLGENVPPDERAFWHATYQKNYTGDAGRKRARISSINLRDRDGLHGRLDGVRCPVMRMHGTEDPVYSVANAEDERSSSSTAPTRSFASSTAAGTS
jgi:pimeloyl-ACP methyl ester carboxylesterase